MAHIILNAKHTHHAIGWRDQILILYTFFPDAIEDSGTLYIIMLFYY
jgi:hypothetical protein